MAATPGQQLQDRCQCVTIPSHLLCRPNGEAGAKVRRSAVNLANE